MNKNEKNDFLYLTLKDIYKEFNHSVNSLILLRDFLQVLLNIKEKKAAVEKRDENVENF